jgi:hypothetical protein
VIPARTPQDLHLQREVVGDACRERIQRRHRSACIARERLTVRENPHRLGPNGGGARQR